jgi:hypothetical protein
MGDSLLHDCLVTFIEWNIFFKVDEDNMINESVKKKSQE